MLATADPGANQGWEPPDSPSAELISALKLAKLDLLDELSVIDANTQLGLYTDETAAECSRQAYAKFEARIRRLLDDESSGHQ